MKSGTFAKSNNLKGLMLFSVRVFLPTSSQKPRVAQQILHGRWECGLNCSTILYVRTSKYTSTQTTSKTMKNTYNFRLLRG